MHGFCLRGEIAHVVLNIEYYLNIKIDFNIIPMKEFRSYNEENRCLLVETVLCCWLVDVVMGAEVELGPTLVIGCNIKSDHH